MDYAKNRRINRLVFTSVNGRAELLNDQESRREWMLWMFKRAGEYNNNNKNYQFWQQNNHPIELSGNEMIDQKLDYIHTNPIEGFVDEAEDYIYSSARDYSGKKGMVDVCFAE